MFESVKNAFKRKKLMKQAEFLASEAVQKVGYAYFPAKEAQELVDADNKLVTRRTDIPNDPTGNVAVALTDAGKAALGALPPASAQTSAPAEKPVFTIETGIPIPAAKRGGGVGASIYPFDKLDVNGSFFVPTTDERKNPAKALASTVSSASKRFKDQTPPRKFTIRAVEGGARIWRTQ